MAIVVIEDRKVLAVKKADFQKEKLEEFLQKSIAENPEIVDLKQLDENIRPLILGTEFDSIDVLGIDQYGNIYIIETKLFKNPDKRLVVAQVLDYGASLWRDYGNETREAAEEFWDKVEQGEVGTLPIFRDICAAASRIRFSLWQNKSERQTPFPICRKHGRERGMGMATFLGGLRENRGSNQATPM